MLIRILAGFLFIACLPNTGKAAERPNILWISVEDISPHLGCYGDMNAVTPHLDKLASEGTRFTHAFSCHGVCAPSRTGIITGMTPISLGANHMRSKARLPEHIRLFPQYLREAGYYCTNNVKTDYNLVWDQKATWDEASGKAHWKNRPSEETPFFSVFNLTMTHESKVWPAGWAEVVAALPEDQRHRPEEMKVPPLYPDTVAVRADLARLADLITVMDLRVGELLKELVQAGLADNTIVFFWSDHGDGLPRAKRWTYDSGTRVPLIVKSPERFREGIGLSEPGGTEDRLVNLIDLAPTVLSLAGIKPPDHMHGVAFLGSFTGKPEDFIFGARDRIDERFDMVRSVRSRRYRYVRNLMPWRPALQHVAYGEQNEILREMRRLLAIGELSPASAQWFDVPRPAEEFYDLDADPWELTNLINHPQHHQEVQALRDECNRWQIRVRDAHLLPEIMLDEGEAETGSRWQVLQGADGEARTTRLLIAAMQTARLTSDEAASVAESLDSDPGVRWWQVTLAGRAAQPESRIRMLLQESKSPHVALRIAAAAGLARAGNTNEAASLLKDALTHGNEIVRHTAMLEIDEAGRDVILSLRDRLSVDDKQEYVRRLAEHAKKQIPE